MYNIPRPEWATDTTTVGAAAAKLDVPKFEPKKGVRIETDPKAESKAPISMTDDESVIESLCQQLIEATKHLAKGYKLNPVQFEKVCCINVQHACDSVLCDTPQLPLQAAALFCIS